MTNYNVTKASKSFCITTNLASQEFCTNETTPVQISVPIVDGLAIQTHGPYYYLNLTYTGSLLSGNNANVTISIINKTSNAVMYSNTFATNSLSQSFSYKIPVTTQVEFSILSSGDSNYTALNIDPVTTPTDIVSYVPINLTNSQTTATPAQFQQIIAINSLNYTSYITYNSNFANFEYFYANGTVIPAWIESNDSNTITTWVKTISIPASSKLTIYLGFASETTNLLSGSGTSGIGEAPQLSSTYAEYDDGASVFLYYNVNPTSTAGVAVVWELVRLMGT